MDQVNPGTPSAAFSLDDSSFAQSQMASPGSVPDKYIQPGGFRGQTITMALVSASVGGYSTQYNSSDLGRPAKP